MPTNGPCRISSSRTLPNNYYDEPAVRAEAMAIADDLGISRRMVAWLLKIFDASRVFEELANLQK